MKITHCLGSAGALRKLPAALRQLQGLLSSGPWEPTGTGGLMTNNSLCLSREGIRCPIKVFHRLGFVNRWTFSEESINSQ